MLKNVYITGTSKGIGKSVKDKFSDNGWNTNEHNSEILDLSDIELVKEYFNKKFSDSPPAVLVLNAATNENILFENIDTEKFQRYQNINTLANIYIIQSALHYMKAINFGRIVLVGSIWSSRTRITKSLYSISKASLKGVCTTLTIEYANQNILTNIVSPGIVKTEMTNNNLSKGDKEAFLNKIPMKRFAEPSEIANLIYFLGSEDNSYISGQEIFIDGGFNIA